MTKKNLKKEYTAFYQRTNPTYVYPPEWAVRTFLGNYPKLSLDKSRYAGSKILDIGFGDGRCFPLLHNNGFKIYGIEITDEIINLCEQRMLRLGIKVVLKKGTNSAIPFEDNFFDYILASSSCYYVDSGTTFSDHLREYNRVLKPGGIFVASLAAPDSFIFKDSIERDGLCEIVNDPYGVRNGCMLRRFRSEDEIRSVFGKYFDSFSFGLCKDDFYGSQVDLFLLVCKRHVENSSKLGR
jgi:SAM-dependent methyltransferase